MKCHICKRDIDLNDTHYVFRKYTKEGCDVIHLCHDCGLHQQDLIEEEKEAFE